MKKITTDDFIEKANLKHDNKYNYSKTIYTLSKNKVIIICPIHGEFEQKANNHLNGKGCPKCKGDKIKQTCIDRYGVDNPSKTDEYKKKSMDTCLAKYGVKYSFQSNNNKDKSKATRLEKYGNEYYNNIDKYKKTCIDRYGVDNPSKTELIKNKLKLIKKDECVKKYTKLNDTSVSFLKWNDGSVKYKCNTCGNIFDIQVQLIRLKEKNKSLLCPKCNPPNISSVEKELYDFIEQNYNKNIENNSRSIIYNLELDIYLPDLKLAFEFNGLYWHSELHKDKNYHLEKSVQCLKKGIHLIHIYEDDWMYKQNIVKSRILNLLGKSKRIYARKCIIKEVTHDVYKTFLENNHIQGSINSKYNIGLYHNNELVSLMTFGQSRFEKDKIELIRFCNKLNITVIGGASRLFKYAITTYKFKEIISYADRSWSNGGLYDTLGFKLIKETKPNYYYVNKGIRENRFKYRKSELIKEGFDAKKTEKEIMFDRKMYRIYDSGSLKYIWLYKY